MSFALLRMDLLRQLQMVQIPLLHWLMILILMVGLHLIDSNLLLLVIIVLMLLFGGMLVL